MSKKDFYSIYAHGFLRCAVCMPEVKVADPQYNAERTLLLARRASEAGAAVALFPELGLSAYSNDDLFHQDALLEATLAALGSIVEASRTLTPVLLVGAPLRFDGRLFNCAVAIYRGRILGVAPKTFLPNYREYYEKRQFTSARDAVRAEVELLGQQVPLGNDLMYVADNRPDFTLFSEICEDVWAAIPPSTYAALAGATVIANLSASNITIGKAEYRRDLVAAQSGRCIAAYLYSAAGPGESTNDLAWDGHALIFENDECLAESERFPIEAQLIVADVDLERLVQERMRSNTFIDSGAAHAERVRAIRRVPFTFKIPGDAGALRRRLERFPYVPTDLERRDERCYEAYNIQVHGLAKRIQSSGIERLVIGVSGGLDSTHALIVAARTMDRLGLPRTNIYAYTMPAFATSDTTLANAHALMNALGVRGEEIDIRPACRQMLEDIGHPYARGEQLYDVTFENVQAGERTSHLFRLANQHHGLVVGTGDLSEIALGWATYGVGDHMSHYNVNVSVPKTLIQYLIRWVIASRQFDEATGKILQAVLDTEISPELVPGEADADGPAQSTEEKIGPYELQDFNTYYITRYGFRPSKVAFLSWSAWHDKLYGDWPTDLPAAKRNAYDIATIKRWQKLFLYRFFKISQFKRTCMPNGPKVGSGGSLSPRGDWRAPSDSEARLWLDELEQNVPDS
jgi:NAD+ synthase (glutamine-hydrolysing)